MGEERKVRRFEDRVTYDCKQSAKFLHVRLVRLRPQSMPLIESENEAVDEVDETENFLSMQNSLPAIRS